MSLGVWAQFPTLLLRLQECTAQKYTPTRLSQRSSLVPRRMANSLRTEFSCLAELNFSPTLLFLAPPLTTLFSNSCPALLLTHPSLHLLLVTSNFRIIPEGSSRSIAPSRSSQTISACPTPPTPLSPGRSIRAPLTLNHRSTKSNRRNGMQIQGSRLDGLLSR